MKSIISLINNSNKINPQTHRQISINMKGSILHSGRLYQYEREVSYSKHKQRITEILKKKPSNKDKKSNSQIIISNYPSAYQLSQQHQWHQENNRLVSKLCQINLRKNYQILAPDKNYSQLIKLSQLHQKYIKDNRLKREKQIQLQNIKFVEKLINQRQQSSIMNIDQEILIRSRSNKKSMRRSKKKQHHRESNSSSNLFLRNKSMDDRQKQKEKQNINQQRRNQLGKQLFPDNKQQRNYSTLILPQVNAQRCLDINKHYNNSNLSHQIELEQENPQKKLIPETNSCTPPCLNLNLKFQRFKQRKTKKRQPILQLTQQNQYLNEPFQLDIDQIPDI